MYSYYMKNKITIISIILITVVALIGGGFYINSLFSKENSQYDVATTIFPVYDITKNLLPADLSVGYVVPVGASPHTYEPSVDDQLNFTETSTIISIGGDFDKNYVELVENSTNLDPQDLNQIVLIEELENRDVEILEFSEGHTHHDEEHSDEDDHHDEEESHEEHSHEGEDPHIWLSPKNGLIMTEIIAENLKSIYPEHESEIEANYQSYKQELELLVEEANELSTKIADSKIITYHDSYRYLAKDLGIEVKGVVEIDAGIEPASEQIAELQSDIREYDIKVVYSEPQLNEDNARIIADDNNLELFILDPLGGDEGKGTYLELIRYNLSIFEESLL